MLFLSNKMNVKYSLCLVTIPLLWFLQSTVAQGEWKDARATFYGNDGGATIHQGSCMFGQLNPNSGTGYDIAALSDQMPEFDESCGRCYEVACRNAVFQDGYGQQLDRSSACYDESTSVVVMITDACPCHYPSNQYSNTRWCCGDMPHFDVSFYAFGKLASEKNGVIGIRYREVDCPDGTIAAQDWQLLDRNRAGQPGTTYRLRA